jgi:hypothetical protein
LRRKWRRPNGTVSTNGPTLLNFVRGCSRTQDCAGGPDGEGHCAVINLLLPGQVRCVRASPEALGVLAIIADLGEEDPRSDESSK